MSITDYTRGSRIQYDPEEGIKDSDLRHKTLMVSEGAGEEEGANQPRGRYFSRPLLFVSEIYSPTDKSRDF